MTSAYSTGRAFMPLPGSLIDVLEYKVSPLVAAVSHTSEKVRPCVAHRHAVADSRTAADLRGHAAPRNAFYLYVTGHVVHPRQ